MILIRFGKRLSSEIKTVFRDIFRTFNPIKKIATQKWVEAISLAIEMNFRDFILNEYNSADENLQLVYNIANWRIDVQRICND